MNELYKYTTPAGFGDTFYQYAFDADALTDGDSPFQQGVLVTDGAFISRFWAGLPSVVAGVAANPPGAIRLWDPYFRRAMSDAALQISNFDTGKVILPESYNNENSYIRFDLTNVLRSVAGVDGALTVYRSQLVFTGARRRKGRQSDPQESNYRWYPKSYEMPYTLAINNYASTGGVLNPPVQFTIPILDFDFELHRVEMATSAQQASQFKITLYDPYWDKLSNVPILANQFFHLDPKTSSGQMNFWPSPPVLYKVNSVIRFDIWSLLFAPTVLPQNFQLNFVGIRRIPC